MDQVVKAGHTMDSFWFIGVFFCLINDKYVYSVAVQRQRIRFIVKLVYSC